ncbi:MAG: DUF61 family protein [Candidatus Methanogranum gryphiswaldense]|nr:MAG: DUF61 family protein [Candidatus Methanogranum sp. U3.2.1]
MSDPIDVERIVSEMNNNMPINRRTLLDYLENGDYTYQTRSGIKGTFGPVELEYLSSICTEIEKMRLRLPIFIGTDVISETGAWKVEGKIESSVVSKMLGKNRHCEDYIQLCYPDLLEVRRLLPELAVVIFLP